MHPNTQIDVHPYLPKTVHCYLPTTLPHCQLYNDQLFPKCLLNLSSILLRVQHLRVANRTKQEAKMNGCFPFSFPFVN